MNAIDLLFILLLLAGLALGFFQGTIKLLVAIISFYVAIMLAILLQGLFVDRDVAGSVTFPIVNALQHNVRGSFLVSFFGNQILPLIYASVRPVLPRESDFIFRVRR